MGEAATAIQRIPDPAEPVPRLAVPTFLLFVGCLGVWLTCTTLAVTGEIPHWVAIVPNALAGYGLFTVAHDAGHRSVSTHEWVNTWIGRLSTPFFAPAGSFGSWRFIHMQHHLHTNDPEKDPDHAVCHARGWTAPLRWFTPDIEYSKYYMPQMKARPRSEKVEFYVTGVVMTSLLVAAIATGHGLDLLLLWYVPLRIAVFLIGWSFDWLPHHGLKARPADDKYKTARMRLGLEKLLAPLMLFQNYHLIHHMHPRVPWYRYIAVWRRNERKYREGGAPVVDPLGRPLD